MGAPLSLPWSHPDRWSPDDDERGRGRGPHRGPAAGDAGRSRVFGIVAIDVGVLGDLVAIPMLGSAIWAAQNPSTDVVVYPR